MSSYEMLVSGRIRSTERLHVVAPFDWPADKSRDDLKRFKALLRDEIIEIIFDVVRGAS